MAHTEQRAGRLRVAQQLGGRAAVGGTAVGQDHAVPGRSRRTTARFCSTSSTGTASAARSSTCATSVTTFGARPLVGSSAMISRLALSRVRPMATICCWPPDSVPANCFARCLSSGNSSWTRPYAGSPAPRRSASRRFSATVSPAKIPRSSGA